MPEPIQTPEPGTEEVQPGTPNPAEPSQPTPPAPDYEKKFSESSRENQLLRERIKALEESGKELTKEPTYSDLRAAFPEWDSLTDFEKRMARETYETRRLAAAANTTAKRLQEDRAWNTSIELAVSSNHALQGREQEFRQFASRPQYRGVEMDLLVSAFLQKNPATPAPTPAPARPSLLPGTGGPKTPDKPKLLDADELKALRKSDEKAYTAYIKAHPEALDDEI